MIKITDKSKCCGCEACSQICPKKCITMKPDEEGFMYPIVDESICINCGLCEKTCPELNLQENKNPIDVFAAINPNAEIRLKSSSGGVFFYLAEKIINQGGAVIGACYDKNWRVKHEVAYTLDDVQKMRGSKYVQSRMNDVYLQTKKLLQNGIPVLFSGTSCQIMALKLFLNKEYDKLLAVELIGAGVPSPLLWSKYLKEEVYPKINSSQPSQEISNIEFREKSKGWKNFRIVISSKRATTHIVSDFNYENSFFSCVLKRAVQRYSCYSCPAKAGRSNSDITLGDFWNYQSDDIIVDDDRGVSVVLANTEKGIHFLEGLTLTRREFGEVMMKNPASVKSGTCSVYRKNFYKRINHKSVREEMAFLKRHVLIRRIVNKLLRLIRVNYLLKY